MIGLGLNSYIELERSEISSLLDLFVQCSGICIHVCNISKSWLNGDPGQ